MDWLQIFVNLILTGILLYVFQRIIDERSDRCLEKFKAELQLVAFERETRFSKLYEKRAEVIEELYKKLLKIQSALYPLKLELGSEKKQYNTVGVSNVIGDTDFYFRENQIYMPVNLCKQIGSFHTKSLSAWLSLVSAENNIGIALLGELDANEYKEKYKEDLADASTQLNEKIVPLIKEIEYEFRNLLGS